MGPCFVATAATPDAYSCCDSKGAPYTPPPLPPTPSPPSSPMVCDAKNNLQQTTFTGGKVVDFIMNNASAWTDCCAACSNATLQKLGCNYWEFQKNLKQHTPGVCTFTSTLGTFSPKGPYSKYGIAGGIRPFGPVPPAPPAPCSPEKAARCVNACAAAANTPVAMGGIHPRDKKPVGDRLGQAAYNLVYGGKGALTGPTLSGCSLTDSKLTITFNASLLSGDKVLVQKYGKGQSGRYGVTGGSYLDVQTNADNFCMEATKDSNGNTICPTWAGGTGNPINTTTTQLDGGWTTGLDITLAADGASISVDLSPLNGTAPTSVRYAWSIVNCCDMNDPDLYVTKPCAPGSCPIMSSSSLPANPFLAKIVDGKCECIAPQVC